MPEAILFGGSPRIPPPEVFEEVRRNNPLWYQVLEKAYEQFASRPENEGVYADPNDRGATLDQIWLAHTLLGSQPVCLLAKPYPAEQMKKIRRVEEVPAGDLVQALKHIHEVEGSINATTLHYDGKTGHCVRLVSYDAGKDRFLYQDPWPEKSLLCKENNMKSVDAKEAGKLWSVSAKELESVLFASFVLPQVWARHEGIEFDLMFDDWREGEFFKFFHLVELDARTERNMHRHMYAPQSFKDQVSLIVDWRDGGKIVRCSLILDKNWMVPNIMLALDIAKSYIKAFSPKPDREAYGELAGAISKMSDPGSMMSMKDADPEKSAVVRCIHAFMGAIPETTMMTDLGMLTFRNVHTEDEMIQEMEFMLF